jgi:Ca2+-binding EF-hand superfamily protein
MKTLLIAAALMSVTGVALAQAPNAPPAPAWVPRAESTIPMRMWNQSQTRDQAVAKVREHFAMLDANKDGVVTQDEMAAKRGEQRGKWREKRAGRGPMGDPAAAFDRLDANKDGMISREEFAKAREMRMERRVEMRGDAPRAGGGMRQHRMGMRGMGHGMMMRQADANNDGKITLAEAQEAAVRHFDMMDANRDGTVTPEERRGAMQKMRAMHAPKAG